MRSYAVLKCWTIIIFPFIQLRAFWGPCSIRARSKGIRFFLTNYSVKLLIFAICSKYFDRMTFDLQSSPLTLFPKSSMIAFLHSNEETQFILTEKVWVSLRCRICRVLYSSILPQPNFILLCLISTCVFSSVWVSQHSIHSTSRSLFSILCTDEYGNEKFPWVHNYWMYKKYAFFEYYRQPFPATPFTYADRLEPTIKRNNQRTPHSRRQHITTYILRQRIAYSSSSSTARDVNRWI